jgi:rubrerythrin
MAGMTQDDFAFAVRTAIEYETRMRDAYLEAAKVARDPVRREIFVKLATDEEGHMEHLKRHLGEWLQSGMITARKLRHTIPDKEGMYVTISKVREKLAPKDYENEVGILQKAYEAETQALSFFIGIVERLQREDHKKLFEDILSAEETHVSIVKAELDYAMSGKKNSWVDSDNEY